MPPLNERDRRLIITVAVLVGACVLLFIFFMLYTLFSAGDITAPIQPGFV